MKKKKSEIKWIDVPIHPLPRHISFVLEDILTELRQIREALGKTGAYPIPNYPAYPSTYPPWYPPGCVITSGINAPGIMSAPPGEYCVPSGERLRPKDCYTKKELEDKFGVKK